MLLIQSIMNIFLSIMLNLREYLPWGNQIEPIAEHQFASPSSIDVLHFEQLVNR